MSLTRTACHHWYTPGDDDPCPQRVGINGAAHIASGTSSPAAFGPTRLSSYACHRCIVATIGYRTTFFGSTARAPTNPPRELPHIFLSALARSVRWTGVYEPRLDAIARDGTSTIHRLHGLLRGDLGVRAADDARYAQISSPV